MHKIATGLNMPIEDLISPVRSEPHEGSSVALDPLISYLKTKRAEDIEFIHKLAVKILERKG